MEADAIGPFRHLQQRREHGAISVVRVRINPRFSLRGQSNLIINAIFQQKS